MASISVALCTFNGARFVEEQLESLVRQERQPDELVVCDDGSNDGTVQLIRRCSSDIPFTVKIRENPKRLGVFRNFEQAIGLCSGEIIAPCDQDDVWRPEKLALMEQVLAENPQAGMVFSDAEVVNDQLQPMNMNLWDCAGFSDELQQQFRQGEAFRYLVNRNYIFGCTMVFRSRLRDLFLPFPEQFKFIHLHDGLIILFTSAVAPIIPLEQKLVSYRQHSGQQIGAFVRMSDAQTPALLAPVERFSAETSYLEYIDYLRVVQQRLVEASGSYDCAGALEDLRQRIRHFQARETMPAERARRLPVIVKELAAGRYTTFSNGVLSAVKDAYRK